MAGYKRTKNYVTNLQRYIKDDVIYQYYKKGKIKEISDFNKFCIDHCEDIEMLLEENRRLKQELITRR